MSKSDLFFRFFVGVDGGFFDESGVCLKKIRANAPLRQNIMIFGDGFTKTNINFFSSVGLYHFAFRFKFFSAKISFFVEWFFATFWFLVVKGSLFFLSRFFGQKLIGSSCFYHSFWIWYFYICYFSNKWISFARFVTSFAAFLFFLAKTDCEVKNERAYATRFPISVFKIGKSH